MSLQLECPCKVNLVLNILGKRADGFHELETLMHPVRVCDRLAFERSAKLGVELSCTNPTLPVNSENLVYRAAAAFLAAAGLQSGVAIHLQKQIPLAAGLGGGSSNAAATLRGLNQLFGSPLAFPALQQIAAGLGSDVPFFLQDSPGVGTGRGEVVRSVEFFPALRDRAFMLIHPGFGVSTPWAYQHLTRFPDALHGQPGRVERLVQSLSRPAGVSALRESLYNSLEAPVFDKYPLLSLYKSFLLEQGALAALMSGSGSTTFAIVEDLDAAEAMARKFREQFGETAWLACVACS